jgi:hypothetical protein
MKPEAYLQTSFLVRTHKIVRIAAKWKMATEEIVNNH